MMVWNWVGDSPMPRSPTLLNLKDIIHRSILLLSLRSPKLLQKIKQIHNTSPLKLKERALKPIFTKPTQPNIEGNNPSDRKYRNNSRHIQRISRESNTEPAERVLILCRISLWIILRPIRCLLIPMRNDDFIYSKFHE